MATTKEKRSLLIKNCIIKEGDVQKLGDALHNVYKNWKRKEKKKFEYNVTYESDGAEKGTTNPSSFKTDFISSNRVLSIEMSFRADSGTEIQIFLTHNPINTSQNKITIESNDSTWVNGNLKSLGEIIESFTPQVDFINKYTGILRLVFSLSLGSILIRLITFIAPNLISTLLSQVGLNFNSDTINHHIVNYFLFGFLGIFPGYFLTGKIKELFPSVEFQIGPEHKLIEKKRRNWLITIFGIGLLPLVLEIVYDFIVKPFIE